MLRVRYLLLPSIAAVALLLTGLYLPPSSADNPASPAVSLPSAHANAEAALLMNEAREALEAGRAIWIETKVWQKVSLRDLHYQAEGRYLTGPERRFRLELQTRVGNTDGRLRMVCDGATVWQATRIGDAPWAVSVPIDLLRNGIATDSAAAGFFSADSFLGYQFRGGLPSWVRELQQKMVWVGKENIRRKDRALVKLTGVWSPAVAESLVSAKGTWPAGLPRMARLYLDSRTLWPHRIEWWGPDPPRPGEVQLVQMEFRDPVLNRPLPPDRCAREFTLDPAAPH